MKKILAIIIVFICSSTEYVIAQKLTVKGNGTKHFHRIEVDENDRPVKPVIKYNSNNSERDNQYGVLKFFKDDQNGRKTYGYAENKYTGRIIIPCEYEDVYWLDNILHYNTPLKNISGITAVKKDGKWGVIDKHGNILIPYSEYDAIKIYRNGTAYVMANGKYGIIDKTGKEVVPCIYDGINDWDKNGLAKVKTNDKWGLIDKTGKEIVPCIYDGIANLYSGFLKVRLELKYGIIDKNGKEIVHCKYDEVSDWQKDGLAKVRLNGKLGYINTAGNEVMPCKYDEITDWKDGLAKVKLNRLWGCIDKDYIEVISCKYNAIVDSPNGMLKVKCGRFYGYFDKSGNEIIPCRYDYIYEWKDGLAKVRTIGETGKPNKYGYYDLSGNEIVPCIYNHLSDWTDGLATAVIDQKGGYIDTKGNFYSTYTAAKQGIPTTKSSSSAASKSVVKQLPILHLVPNSLRFTDPSGNNAIDADEICRITFRVSNTGKGAGIGCIARIKTSAQGISIADKKLPTIPAGETITVEIPVTASQTTVDGKADFRISVYEPNGFGCDPTMLTVATKAFVSPMLQITDYAVSGTENATIVKRQPFDLQLLLQNTAHGTAENVVVEIKVPDNVFITEGTRQFKTASMQGGAKRMLNYSLIVNNNYAQSSVPVTVSVREKNGDRYTRSRTITLPLNQAIASSNRVVVDEVKSAPQEDISIARIEGKVQPADVDVDIPVTRATNENTFAVIIANENYSKLARVQFALNDGRIFGEYCRNTLGLPASNVRYYPDATYGDMIGAVKDIQRIAAAYDGNICLIFYYAGHGAPEETSKDAYMLPTDAYGVSSDGCYALSRLYGELGDLRALSVTVFFDACFSGGTRDGKVVASARGVALKPKEETLTGNVVVFSAVSGDQTALPFAEKGHGLFTYYLLKKLQESRGDVSFGELSGYIDTNVSRQSNVVNRKPQTPTVTVSPMLAEKWRNMKLK